MYREVLWGADEERACGLWGCWVNHGSLTCPDVCWCGDRVEVGAMLIRDGLEVGEEGVSELCARHVARDELLVEDVLCRVVWARRGGWHGARLCAGGA